MLVQIHVNLRDHEMICKMYLLRKLYNFLNKSKEYYKHFLRISLSWKVLKSEKFSTAAIRIFRTLRATKWQSKSTYVMGGSKLWQFFVCVLKLVNHWCNKFMPTPFDGPILSRAQRAPLLCCLDFKHILLIFTAAELSMLSVCVCTLYLFHPAIAANF